MEKEYHVYKVNKIKKDALVISGKGENTIWKEAEVLTRFVSPWDKVPQADIEFKALWDGFYFFFCFRVFDTQIHIDKKDDSIDSINNSDRVELFFRSDKTLNPYYCLEMDTEARIMDFKACTDKQFDFEWNWPQNDISVKSSKDTMGFTVEGAISIISLKQLQLIKDNIMETGVFRAKYNSDDGINFEPTWITWVNPDTEAPNFHIASSFGVFHLME